MTLKAEQGDDAAAACWDQDSTFPLLLLVSYLSLVYTLVSERSNSSNRYCRPSGTHPKESKETQVSHLSAVLFTLFHDD